MDKARLLDFAQKIKNMAKHGLEYLRGINIRERLQILWINIKNIKPRKLRRLYKRISKKISSSWKMLLSAGSCFLFVYYVLGSMLVENMDVTSGYQLPKNNQHKSEIANTLAFLINREIDSKMWTPNLPIIFPAYVLDNMPNFQTGIMTSVRDGAITLKNFVNKTGEQQKNTKKAEELLRYPPHIWLMSKKGSFGLAPSANAQYRKARSELLKFNKADFTIYYSDFETYLRKLSNALRLLIQKNDSQVIEHSASLLDTKADDVFYKTRGYAFGAWQIARAAGFDFKPLIVQNDIYTEWTYLVSYLQKAAEFKPLMVRNGKPDGIFGANHLIVQNYYLERALVAVSQIQTKLQKKNAHKN